MESLLVNITFMPKGIDDIKYLLVATSEIMNFELVIPSKTTAITSSSRGFDSQNHIHFLAHLNFWL